jgi:excisionase family DNA binding protein
VDFLFSGAAVRLCEPMSADSDVLLTPAEVCERLKISPATLARMFARNEIAFTRLGGESRRPVRVHSRDLDDALAAWSVRGAR